MAREKVELNHAVLVEPSQLFCKVVKDGVLYQCRYYSGSYNSCGLNKWLVIGPRCEVTQDCPLQWKSMFSEAI